MNRRLPGTLAFRAACAGALLLGGCNVSNFFGWAMAGDAPTTTVKAEFDQLDGKSVAIVIYADHAVQFEYPTARLELSAVLRQELEDKIQDVQVVDPATVMKYQDSNLHWYSMDKTQLGKVFGADYVLYLALAEFATREVGSTTLFRGRIAADAAIYDSEQSERTADVWRCTELRVTYPEGGPGQSLRDEADVRYQTEKRLADQLVKRFYKHKVLKTP